ncbi:MAG TPA: lipid-A-disaccharide synthase [Spirochaetota bacterium]|nr:lipid-A-disaccharide synthase [Spirochaetota bacterium]HNT10538.1 lipid-A-disaccharide synthase [Spirochaetota bacterium]
MKRTIFIMTGEASGDLHGAMLVWHIREITDEYQFVGVGGSEMEQAGVTLIDHYSQYSAMGLIEPLKKIRFFQRAFKRITAYIADNAINTVITVDYPGFNLPLAKRLYRHRPRVIHYISPQLWAWHYSRIHDIRKFFYAVVALYPFEVDMYRAEGVRAYFHGNPLVDSTLAKLADGAPLTVPDSIEYVALLPGSRLSEVSRHIKPLVDAAVILRRERPVEFLVPILSGPSGEFVRRYLADHCPDGLPVHIVENNTQRAIERARIVITSSGTATLETAILETPMIIIYRVSILFEILGTLLVRVKDIGLVNIVAGRRICPELTQRDASGAGIAREAMRLLADPAAYDTMLADIRAVKERLGAPGAIRRIARQFVELIEE